MQNKICFKTISVLLSFVFVILIIPTAFAASPISLKATNVTEWPIATGEIYYGQMVSEGITISGGKVEYNGVEVPGKFIHWKDEFRPTAASDASKASITFVPDDTTAYKGFNKLLSTDVTFKVKKSIPVLLNENNPPVATSIKAGETLSLSVLSGGTVKNPWNEDLDLSSISWEWVEPDLVVTESGEYDAKMPLNEDCYETLIMKVFVEVEKDIEVSVIKDPPHFNEITYNPNITFSDLILEGGKAVVSGTDIEVPGSFTITDYWKQFTPTAGTYEIDGIFTPNDTEAYKGFEFKIPVTVNAAPISFVDDEGNPVEDFTFEVEPGTKMNDIKALITTNLRVPKNAVISVEDNNKNAVNGRKYKLTVLHDDPNYTGKDLYFTVSFKEKTITPSLKWVGAGKLKVDCGDYSPPGSFAVYYVIGETETKIGDVKGNSEILEWTPTSSGDYGFKVEYNPVENDYFIIESVTTTNYSHFPEHKLIATGSLTTLTFSMGETATVIAPATDPAILNKPYYGFTCWTDVNGNTGLSEEELANATVSFAMPDGDVELRANYEFSIKLYFEWVWQQIVQFFTFIANAVKDLFALATA